MDLSLKEWTGNKLSRIISTLERAQDTVIPRSSEPAPPPITPELLGKLEAVADAMEMVNDDPEAYAEALVGANKTAPTIEEISSSKSDIYGEYKIQPYNPDDLVGKRGLEIYKKIKNDDQVKAVLATKKATRLATRWKIVPGTTSQTDRDVADFIHWNLENMDGTLESDLYEILSALEYGFSVTEIVWAYITSGPWKGKLGLKSLKTRKPFNFHFKTDDHDNLEYILQRTTKGDIELPPDKFIVYSHNKTFDNYYGESELRAVYRNIFSKDIILKFWNLWLERYPSPVTLGYYPLGTPKSERDDLLTILKRIQIATAAILPENLEVDFVQNQNVGHAVFKEAVEFHNKSITRGLLVPDLLGFTETTGPGSYALGKTHFDVYMAILRKLGREIEEPILFEQLIKRLVKYNFTVVAYPKFRFEAMSEDNVEARAKVVQILAQAQIIDPKEAWVREYLNIPGPEETYAYSEAGLDDFCLKRSEPIVIGENGGTQTPPQTPPISGSDQTYSHRRQKVERDNLGTFEDRKDDKKEDQEKRAIFEDEEFLKELADKIQSLASGENRDSITGRRKDAVSKSEKEGGDQLDLGEVATPQDVFSSRFSPDSPTTWRKLTVFERAAKFNPLATLEDGEEWLKTATDSISTSVSGMIGDAVKQVQSKKLLSGRVTAVNDQSYRAIQEIKVNPREARSKVLNSLIYGYFQGKESAFGEVETALGKRLKFSETGPSPSREDLRVFTEIASFPDVLPAEAITAFKGKVPLVLLKRSFASLLQRERTIAFSVAGVIEKDTLISIQELLIKAMEGGWTLEEFEHQVRARSIQYTGEAYRVNRTGEPIKAFHLETILRTNYSDVFNRGRRNLLEDPDVIEFVPAWQYSGILDSRIRKTHKEMDGKVFLRTDPIWKKWYPPCGYSCRCIVIPVTVNQDFTISPKAPPSLVPDSGFGGLDEESTYVPKRAA